MTVLIAYAGKTGTTAKCAKILKALVDDAELCDLTKEKPELSRYQSIILGSSVRMGSFHKACRHFIKKNKELLMRKKCAFYICNCFSGQSEGYLRKNIPKDLLKKAVAAQSFGGELMIENQKGLDHLITKMVAKRENLNLSQKAKFSISSEAINKFAEKVNRK